MARKSGAGGIIVAALGLGVITAFVLGSYLRKQSEKDKANWQEVVVALQPIGPRTKITRAMITVDHYPKELLAPNTFTKPEDVVNRMTKDGVKAKEQIRETDLLGEGQFPTYALKVHEGMRAVAIAVDEVKAVGTAVQPGDHVDIIATFQDPRTKQIITKMILQNVLVLFVDRGRTDSSGEKGGATTSMSLEVKPEQTELVKAAERSGTLAVTLRGVNENTIIASEGVTERELGGGMPETSSQPERTPVVIMPPPSNAIRQKPEITIIRATEEKTITP